MYPAIFAKTYPGKIAAEVLDAAAADGFRGVQFNLVSAGIASLPNQLPYGLAMGVRKHAAQKQLHIAALSGTYNMAHPDAAVRAESRKGFANVVKAAQIMGASVVTLCTGSRDAVDMWRHHPENGSAAAWHDLRTELDYALGLAEAADINLGIEPEPGNVIRDAQAAKQLLTEVRSPQLGIVLDAANLLSADSLPQQDAIMKHAVGLLGEDLLLAHAKDIDNEGRVIEAGKGAVHLQIFVTLLRAAGFDGALVGHGFGPEKARVVAGHLARLIESAHE